MGWYFDNVVVGEYIYRMKTKMTASIKNNILEADNILFFC